jgi:REP element-mobilizing transposase RayT
MSDMIGYMLTWTTYGTWLPGDPRGYVEDGNILPGDDDLLEYAQGQQKYPALKLNADEKKIVHETLLSQAEQIGQLIESLVVYSNHVHLLLQTHPQTIEKIVSRYKSTTTRLLWRHGRKGKIWSTGFDKRFCFSQNEMVRRKTYILNHNS